MTNLLGIIGKNTPSFKYPNGVAPFFGDGSDGDFYPLPSTTSVQATIGSSSSLSPGYTNMTAFYSNATVCISGIQVYTTGATIPLTMYLFDSSGNNLGSGTVTTVAGGWTVLTLPKPVQLTQGSTYYVGHYFSGTGLNFMSISSAPQNVSGPGGIVFTFGPSNLHYYGQVNGWPGTGTSGTPATAIGVIAYAPTNYTFTSSQDGGPVIKQFKSINVPVGVTVSVSNRCQGLILMCQGDVTIAGSIIMDGLAPLLDPTITPGLSVATAISQLYYPAGNNKFIPICMGGAGGSGGTAGNVSGNGSLYAYGGQGGSGNNGSWWGGGRGGGGGGGCGMILDSQTYFKAGGGGAGGSVTNYTSSPTGGSAVTVSGVVDSGYSGNPGSNGGGGSGGMGVYNQSSYTQTGAAGGGGLSGGGGGGGTAIGNINASNTYSAGSQYSGGGGLILIIANGNITINSGGALSAKGSVGGNGGNGYVSNQSTYAYTGGGGGGGAGGGVISLLYGGTYSNSGSLNVSGGGGGSAGSGAATGSYSPSYTPSMSGIAGNNGFTQIQKITA